jgi:uncharacterized protein (DUF488 family)
VPETPTIWASIWTIGHSTHAIDEFIGLLRGQRIDLLVDVRTHPGSRRFPQFNQQPLRGALAAVGIEYTHAPDLGGLRKPRPDSRNTAWRNGSFRGYADYMETQPFAAALAHLIDSARGRRAAIMCAEAHWKNCHRGLIADALKASGLHVLHINSDGTTEEHPYTAAARLVNGRLSYTEDQGLFGSSE